MCFMKIRFYISYQVRKELTQRKEVKKPCLTLAKTLLKLLKIYQPLFGIKGKPKTHFNIQLEVLHVRIIL